MESNKKISVAIRNKNEASSLDFLLKTLTSNYFGEISQIVVIDNCSTDSSKEIALKYGADFVTVENFSYGGSANLAMDSCFHDIVILMSAHVFPVSHDFFKLIKNKFDYGNENLAGLRCIHYLNDYKLYLEKKPFTENMNGCGLMFACSAINKKVWIENRFLDNILTNEDKEWSRRVVSLGYYIEFVPSIFCYYIKRTKAQEFFRFKNEMKINYYLWGISVSYYFIFKDLIARQYLIIINIYFDFLYLWKRFFFLLNFKNKIKNRF